MTYDPSHKTSSISSNSSNSTFEQSMIEEQHHYDYLSSQKDIIISNHQETNHKIIENQIQVDLKRSNYYKDQGLKNNTTCIEPKPIFLQHGSQLSNHHIIIPHTPTHHHSIIIPQKSDSQDQFDSKQILSDNEKRTNHILSEQKRRNTIRSGFRDLTEIVPTLKNVNNSKSTILFKTVEYMKYLDRRNKSLKEKVTLLNVRVQVEGSQKRPQKQMKQHSNPSLPADTISALIAHKNQQSQLEELQRQLSVQHQLLRKHNLLPSYHSISIPKS